MHEAIFIAIFKLYLSGLPPPELCTASKTLQNLQI